MQTEQEYPDNESARLKALHAYHVLDTPPEDAFDRLTRIASDLFSAPIALISLIDLERQWFKSSLGMKGRETPREWSFCARAILRPEILVVDDARTDPKFCDNPMVTGEPFIRFYAGAPLVSPEGHVLGTLCVIDPQPRPGLGERHRQRLQDLAAIAMDLMEARRRDLTRA